MFTRRIEYLLAHEDGTWFTRVFDVPEPVGLATDALLMYATSALATQAQYRDIVFWGVFNTEPDDGTQGAQV